MKRLFFCVSLLLFVFICFSNDFISNQKTYPRVRTAYQEKEPILKNRLKEQGLSLENLHILIVAFKAEKELEIFAKSKQQKKFVKIGTYNICRTSGNLGPKNKSGDYQTPEGFYNIDRFNPSSLYHLSLGINYPNETDKIRSKASNLGGDIFIHGKCVTIGCLPMTNEGIKEIYLYAINAKQNGQNNIPVYIFPYRLSNANIKIYTEAYKNYPELLGFWDNLKLGYDKFNHCCPVKNIKFRKSVFTLAGRWFDVPYRKVSPPIHQKGWLVPLFSICTLSASLFPFFQSGR